MQNVDIKGDYSVLLTFDSDGALLTTRGKDHDLDERQLTALRDACNDALAAIRIGNPIVME